MSSTITTPSARVDGELRLNDGDIARGIAIISNFDCVPRDKAKEMPVRLAANNVLNSYGRRDNLVRWFKSVHAITTQDQQTALVRCLAEYFRQK